MAVTVYERYDSRKLSVDNRGAKGKFVFFALKSNDELEVYNAVNALTPLTWQGLVKRAINTTPKGGGFWEAEVDYETPEGVALVGQGGPGPAPSPDSSGTPGETQSLGLEFSFDTAGGTTHVSQSLETINTYSRTEEDAPDNSRAIGARQDGTVEGCDIYSPKLEFSISRRVSFVTIAYIKQLRTLTGKVNLNPFLHFAAGELLLLGASGQYRENDGWTVNYKFAAAENEVNIEIAPPSAFFGGDALNGIEKDGWDYLWVGYREAISNDRSVMQPAFAYVERVYKRLDFATYLGWGA